MSDHEEDEEDIEIMPKIVAMASKRAMAADGRYLRRETDDEGKAADNQHAGSKSAASTFGPPESSTRDGKVMEDFDATSSLRNFKLKYLT